MRNKSLICALALFLASPAVFASCKDLIKETRQEIDDNRDNYSLVSRNKAKVHLMKAEADLLNPLPSLDCRKMVRKAKSELRHGEK